MNPEVWGGGGGFPRYVNIMALYIVCGFVEKFFRILLLIRHHFWWALFDFVVEIKEGPFFVISSSVIVLKSIFPVCDEYFYVCIETGGIVLIQLVGSVSRSYL